MEYLKSKKFLLAVGSQLGNLIALFHGSLDAVAFSTVTVVVVGGYYTSNVTQKATIKLPATQ
jgi:hypothetical protein